MAKGKIEKKYNNIFGQFKYKEEKKSNGHVIFAVAHCDICCFFSSKGAHGEKKQNGTFFGWNFLNTNAYHLISAIQFYWMLVLWFSLIRPLFGSYCCCYCYYYCLFHSTPLHSTSLRFLLCLSRVLRCHVDKILHTKIHGDMFHQPFQEILYMLHQRIDILFTECCIRQYAANAYK